jgi:hypothetical protein
MLHIIIFKMYYCTTIYNLITVKPCLLFHGVNIESKKICHLKIFKIEFNKINGGSIRCYVTHENNEIYDNNVDQNKIKKVLHYESIKGVKSKTLYLNFYKKINYED